jgi:hypothetical protein
MEIIIYIVLFYLFTPGIIIKVKSNNLIYYTLVSSIIFGIIITGIFKILKLKIENLDEDEDHVDNTDSIDNKKNPQPQNKIICKNTEVHNIKGDGPECVQCPVINGKQLVSFPTTVKTNKGTFNFDGYCGYANRYEDGRISTVISPNNCLHANDLPLKIPSYDSDLRFCLANPFGTKIPNGQIAPTITGDNKFNVIIPDIKNPTKLPFYFMSN